MKFPHFSDKISSFEVSPNELDQISKRNKKKSTIDWIYHLIYVKLWIPIPSSCLAFFRIIWGLIMFYESLTYTFSNYYKIEKIVKYHFRFKYYGFEWVEPFAGNGNYFLVYTLIISSLCISCGFLYRLNTIIFFLGFSYIFFLEATEYLNHYYLVCVISFLIIFLPLNAYWALDNFAFPSTHRVFVPYWTLWIFQVLISVVYFYAGIAKMNVDWLRGEPLVHWLKGSGDVHLIGSYLKEPWIGVLFSYAAILLDTFIGVTLLIPQLRILCFITLVCFHLLNKLIFNIGVFPWIMLLSVTLYFEPDWLIRLDAWLKRKPCSPNPMTMKNLESTKKSYKLTTKQILVLIGLGIFLLHQILVPLRHLLYPGDVNWTEEGHYYSWRMKLRDKRGYPKFFVTDPSSNETLEVNMNSYLTRRQIAKISCRPQLLHFFAHHIADKYYQEYGRRPKVLGNVICSLNYRPYQYMIRPDSDLTAYPLWKEPQPWIIPLISLNVEKHKDFASQKELAELKTFSPNSNQYVIKP